MSEEVAQGFNILCKAGELFVILARALGGDHSASKLNKLRAQELEMNLDQRRLKDFVNENVSGAVTQDDLKKFYGRENLDAAQIPKECMDAFRQAASDNRMIYSVGQAQQADGTPGDYIVYFPREHSALMQGAMQASGVGRLLSDAELSELTEHGTVEPPIADFDQFITARPQDGQSIACMTGEVAPQDVRRLWKPLAEAGIPARFTDEQGRVDKVAEHNRYFTFLSDDAPKVVDVLKQEGIQLRERPTEISAQIYGKESLHHLQHRRQFMQQEAGREQAVMEIGHKQVLSLTPDESKAIQDELQKENILCVADHGQDGMVDILVTDDDARKVTECMNRVGITKEMRDVGEFEMEEAWKTGHQKEIGRMDARAKDNRAAEKGTDQHAHVNRTVRQGQKKYGGMGRTPDQSQPRTSGGHER